MAKKKCRYEKILQQNNGYGWYDVESFETNSTFSLKKEQMDELKYLKKEYKIAQPNSSLRVIGRKSCK